MAKIKPERAYAKEIFDGFSGIGSDVAVGGRKAADIRNFRILSDGSLQKRCGWRLLHTLSFSVRAYWEGNLGGVNHAFAVSGSHILRLSEENAVMVGSLSDESGNLQFFTFGEKLFLLGGSSILSYRASTDSFIEAEGYAPIFGFNWHPTDFGEIHEPLNMLSKNLRIHYLNSTGTTVFTLPFYAQSIEKVRVNGLLTTNFSLDSTALHLTVPGAASASSIEVSFTMKTADDMRKRIISCKNVFLEQGEDQTILALYGSSYGNLLFCAANVSEIMLNGSKAEFPNSDALYFPQNRMLTLGDRDHPLTSLFYHMGRVLAFHDEGAFSVYFPKDSGSVEYYPLLRGMGCSAVGAELYLDGDPVVCNNGGIFRLHATAGHPDVFEVNCLSEGVPKLSQEQFAGNAVVFEDPAHRELWFCNPSMDSGLVWIYQSEQKQWVSFDSISPSFFFFADHSVGFASNQNLCVFDEAMDTDNGSPITASYTTPYLPFSHPENIKRALRLTACVQGTPHDLEVTVKSERQTKQLTVWGLSSDAPVVLDVRVPLGKFQLAQVALRDRNISRTRIFRLALLANL